VDRTTAAAGPGNTTATQGEKLSAAKKAAFAAGEAADSATGATASHAGGAALYSAPQMRAGWTHYSAGTSPRSTATLSAQPEPRSAMVWLGSGLVGVAGASGLVLFRLRNP
jgi:hypothetical protein